MFEYEYTYQIYIKLIIKQLDKYILIILKY